MDGITATIEAADGQWYCTLRRGAGGKGGRLSTGSGSTRPLAIARAVLNGRLEAGEPVPASDAHRLLLRGFARRAEGPSACSSCGSELPVRARPRTHSLCGVCSWNRTKHRLHAQDSPAPPQ
ncbi:MAG: hypothetical protein LC796_00705 [Acidobacteria bacterium]|nr:hypothetical protein [Acidobacteriota bacterium]MCA1612083.1 hypothetical protein [Acidobacteriota bacterium]